MKAFALKAALAVVVVVSGVVLAQDGPAGSRFGSHEYTERCAGCHGASGKGDGVNQAWLDRSPSDLTVLAKNNGGEFPYMHFYAVVDGRFEDGREMPCFADVYLESAKQDYLDVPYETERYVETRLVALASHVATLQAR